MDLIIYLDIPSFETARKFEFFVNDVGVSVLKSVRYKGKEMLSCRINQINGDFLKIKILFQADGHAIQLYFVNEANRQEMALNMGMPRFKPEKELRVPLAQLFVAGSSGHIREIKRSGGGPFKRSVVNPGRKKRMRTDRQKVEKSAPQEFIKQDPKTANFDHYETRTEEEMLKKAIKKKLSTEIDIFFATDRKKIQIRNKQHSYTNDRGKLRFGICKVNVPMIKKRGEIPEFGLFSFSFAPDKGKHMMILSGKEMEASDFFGQMNEKVNESEERDAFVYVHGYKNSFKDSILRAAQIAYDVGFTGAPVVYSWPSKNKTLWYNADESTVARPVQYIIDLLLDIRRFTGAEKIHLIAHSMGNRALTDALKVIVDKGLTDDVFFNQIILAAPDIDTDVFINDVVPRMGACAERVTLYASEKDRALKISRFLHGKVARAGLSDNGIIVEPEIDTVDASNIKSDFWKHNYFADAKEVIHDIYLLTKYNHPPTGRNLLPVETNDGVYWEFSR